MNYKFTYTSLYIDAYYRMQKIINAENELQACNYFLEEINQSKVETLEDFLNLYYLEYNGNVFKDFKLERN